MPKWFDEAALADRLEFAVGLAIARNRLERGQAGLAERLSQTSKLPIKQPAVSRWLAKKAPSRPSLEHIVALARLAGVDAGWLALGDLSLAPAPDSWEPITPQIGAADEDDDMYEPPAKENVGANPDTPTRRRASFRKVTPEPTAAPKRKRGRS